MKNKYLHLSIGLLLALLIGFLLPEGNGLTAAGVRTIAVTAMIVYYWTFVGIDWVSILCIALFAVVGTASMSSLIGWGISNTNTLLMLFSSILCLSLVYCGFMDRLITWFISRNVVRRRPYVFLALYLLAVYIIGCFVNITSTCLITMPVAKSIIEELGYTSKDKFSKALFAGSMWVAMWGYSATPIGHPVALTIIGLLNTSCGVEMSFVQYMAVGIPITFLLCILSFLVIKYIMRPDTSKYVNYDVDAKRASLKKMELREALTVAIFLLVIFFYVFPDILRYALPGFYTYMNQLTLLTPTILGICLMVIIQVGGKPLFDFKRSLKDVPWSTFFLLAGMFTMSGAISAEGNGIVDWLANVLGPLTANMQSWIPFILLIGAAATILTNFMSCNVLGNMMFMAGVPLMARLGDNLNTFGVAMVIAIASNAGVMTPQASAAAGVYLGTDYLTPSEGFKYGSWVIPAFIVICLALVYPMCLLLF